MAKMWLQSGQVTFSSSGGGPAAQPGGMGSPGGGPPALILSVLVGVLVAGVPAFVWTFGPAVVPSSR